MGQRFWKFVGRIPMRGKRSKYKQDHGLLSALVFVACFLLPFLAGGGALSFGSLVMVTTPELLGMIGLWEPLVTFCCWAEAGEE